MSLGNCCICKCDASVETPLKIFTTLSHRISLEPTALPDPTPLLKSICQGCNSEYQAVFFDVAEESHDEKQAAFEALLRMKNWRI